MTPGGRGSALPYQIKQGQLFLQVRAIPNAGRNEIVGARDGELVVKLQVPAREGRANRELIRLLAGRLGVSRSLVVLAAGQSSRYKRLRLPAEVSDALDGLCRGAD